MKKLRLGAALLLLGISALPTEAALPDGCWMFCQVHTHYCVERGDSDEYCSGLFWGCVFGCYNRDGG